MLVTAMDNKISYSERIVSEFALMQSGTHLLWLVTVTLIELPAFGNAVISLFK